jgi:hypothetical protein
MDEKPWTRGRALLLLVGGCVAGAISFGLILDQITIRIAPEYFTVYHPRIISSDDLTMTALAWGVTATWWVGLILGVYLALVAISGELPISTKKEIQTTILVIFAGTVLAVIVMGIRGLIKQPTSTAFSVGDNHAITRAHILHLTSYLTPIPLTIGMSIWMISRRYKRNLEQIRASRS